MTTPTITVTKLQIRNFFFNWELNYTDGKTMNQDEFNALPIEERVRLYTEFFWKSLGGQP